MSIFEKVSVKKNFVLICVLGIISFFSCEIGLGPAVDTESPEVKITIPNPESIPVIRDTFPIIGAWTDDGTIDYVEVVVTSNATGKQLVKTKATLPVQEKNTRDGTWSVLIDPDKAKLSDGAYSVNVTIKDTAGHTAATSSQIRIDNTPPLIVLQRPSSVLSDATADAFGKTLSLIGQSTDDNSVPLMKLAFYHNSDFSDTPVEVEIPKVPDTINLDLAHFELNSENVYAKIYNSTTLAGTKPAYFKLTAYDGAQKFEADGTQTEEDALGNAANTYYIYDDIADLISACKITGLYQILAGTYDNGEAGRSANEVEDYLSQLQQNKKDAGKFTLNPANTPVYTISGAEKLVLPSTDLSECADFFAPANHDNITLSLGAEIQFNVMPGLDETPLKNETLIPYAIEYPEPASGEKKVEIEITERKSTSSSDGVTVYTLKGLISESKGFEANKCYRIVLDGEDKDGIRVEPEGNGYAFYCRKIGDGPKLEITTPETANINKKGGDTVTIAGNVEYTETGTLNILLNGMGESAVSVFSFDTAETLPAGVTQDTEVTTKYYFTYTIPYNKFKQTETGKYKVEIQAVGDSITVSENLSVVYDIDAPEITIYEPEPVAHKYDEDTWSTTAEKYLNGTVKIKASVKDVAGGSDLDLSKSYLQYGTDNSTWKNYEVSILKGTNAYSVNTEALSDLTDGKVYFRVSANDNSGNTGYSAVLGPYIVDQATDEPAILPGKDWMKYYGSKDDSFDDDFTKNLLQVKKVYFRLVDDDDNGLNTVSVKVYHENGTEKTGVSVKDFTSGKKESVCYIDTKAFEEGKYKVVFTAKDINGVESSRTTWINITAAAPKITNVTIDNKYINTNEDAIAPTAATEPFVNAKKKITANFKINSTTSPFKVTYKITKVNDSSEEILKDFVAKDQAVEPAAVANEINTYSYQITPDAEWVTGRYKLQFKVFDKNGVDGIQNAPIDFYIDNSRPTISGVSLPDVSQTENATWDFDITAADKDGDSGYPAKYFIAFANKADNGTISGRTGWLDATSLKSYPLTFTNLSTIFGTEAAPNSGNKVVYVKVQDAVGNLSEEFSRSFIYDKHDPKVKFTKYTVDGVTTNIASDDLSAKAKFTLSAEVNDDWGISTIELTEKKVTQTDESSQKLAVKISSTGIITKADDSDLTLPIDGLDTAVYEYTLSVKDKADKSIESKTIKVQIDQDKPELTINPIASEPLTGSIGFRGKATDTGLGVKSIIHKIVEYGAAVPADSEMNTLELSSNDWRLSVQPVQGKPAEGTAAITWNSAEGKYTIYEGKYKFYARAKDKADNVSENDKSVGFVTAVDFVVDFDKPEIISAKLITGGNDIALAKSAVNYFKPAQNSNVTLQFSVKETNGLGVVKIDGNTLSIPSLDSNKNYTFNYVIPATHYTGDNKDKSIDIEIYLKDATERENSVTYKVYNDTKEPDISIDNPASDVSGTNSISGSSFIFSATVKDAAGGSGLKNEKFYYIFTKDNLTTEAAIKTVATGTNGKEALPGSTGNWSLSHKIGTGKNGTAADTLYEGNWNLYIYAEDALGNVRTEKRNFWIDQAAPAISEISTLKDIYNEPFSLTGKTSDENGIESVTVTDNGNEIPESAVTASAGSNGGKNFTINFITTKETAATGKYQLTEGKHEFIITTKDKAGKTSEEKRSVTIDTKPPVITSITTATPSKTVDSKKWYDKNYIGVTVTGVTDIIDGKGTGIAKVEVNGTELSLSSDTEGKYTGSAYCTEQGKNTIKLKITDKAGNVNEAFTNPEVYIDTEQPATLEITEIKVGTETVQNLETDKDILVDGKQNITIKVKAIDGDTAKASGIEEVSLTKPVETAIVETSGESNIYTITIPKAAIKTGAIVLTAKDKVGNIKTFTSGYSITLDNTPPEVKKINVPSAVNGKLALSGTVYDNRSSFKSVDVFYYVDSTVSGFKKWESLYHDEVAANHKPSANWELAKTETSDTRLDTSAFTTAGVTDNTKIYILTVVYDEAGNCNIELGNDSKPALTLSEILNSTKTIVTDSIKELTLNQDSDRPVITLNGITLSDMASNNLKKISENSISGRITDDDGIKELYYSEDDGANWKEITLSQQNVKNTTFTWADFGEGTYNGSSKPAMKFKVVDTEGGIFITQASTTGITGRPKFTGAPSGNGAANLSAEGLYLKIDRTAPDVKEIGVKTSASATEYEPNVNGLTVGGNADHRKFWLQFYAYDANPILTASTKVVLSSETGDTCENTAYTRTFTKGATADQKEFDGIKYDLYTITEPFDVEKMVSGTRTLSLEVDDGTKPNKNNSFTIRIDNEAPVVLMTNHEEDELLNIAFNLKGDIRGCDEGTKLYYSVTTSTTPDWNAANNTAGEVKGIGTGKWAISFDDGISDDSTTHSLTPKSLVLALTTSPAVVKNASGVIVYAAGEANAGELYRDVNDYYFHFRVEDQYGNPATKYFKFRIDPQGDIPTVKRTETDDEVNGWVNTTSGIWYVDPENGNTWGLKKEDTAGNPIPGPAGYDKSFPAALMSGVARISGTASAQNGIKAIFMQVDPTYDATTGFNENWADETLPNFAGKISEKYAELGYDYEPIGNSGKYGIKVGSTQTWNYSFNKHSEFEKTEAEYNIIAIRLYVVDKVDNDNTSLTEADDLFIIRLDSGAPKIGSSEPLVLRQYSTNATGEGTVVKEINYEKNIWLPGEWWLCGSVEDPSGINSLTIGGTALVENTVVKTVSNGSVESKSFDTVHTEGYSFKYKVGSNSAGASTLTYTISVTDTDNKPATETVSIRYDNNPPTLVKEGNNYNIPKAVKNDHGFYSLQASAKENSGESGYLRTVFYFKRTLAGHKKVYDSYLKKTSAVNALSYEGADADLIGGTDEWAYLYWKEKSISSIDGSKVTLSAADDNIHEGGLVKLKGAYYRIESVSGTEVELEQSLDDLNINTTNDKIYFAIGHVVDHEGSETPGKLSEINKTDEKYYGYYEEDKLIDDDGDRMIESYSTIGIETTWSGTINSNNIPDGKIEIHYVVFDAAGNHSEEGIVEDAIVGNNAPRLAGLKVTSGSMSQTFYYGSQPRLIGNEYLPRATNLTDAENNVLIVSGDGKDEANNGSAFMTVKDKIQFIPEMVGGNGALTYEYYVSHTKTDGTSAIRIPATGTTASPANWTGHGFDDGIDDEDDDTGYYQKTAGETYIEAHSDNDNIIEFDAFSALGKNSKTGKPTWFYYTLKDSTAGTPLEVEFHCALDVQYFDSKDPDVAVTPLFWTDEKENSLYNNSRDNGHIELKSKLTDTLKGTTYGGDHDKVSGKITMSGTASDNIRVSELWAKISNFTFKGTETADENGFVKIATYNGTSWTSLSPDSDANMSAKNWTLTVDNIKDDETGHEIQWKLSWDTEKLTNLAAKTGVEFSIYAKDELRGNSQNSSDSSTYTVDVVPYITDVQTSLSSIQETNPSVYSRTALGHYPVYIVTKAKNDADVKGETITYKGFNLGSATQVTIGTNDASGKRALTVDSVPSINNENDNTQPYNQCPNNENNNNLTDDVYLDVWQFNSRAAEPVEGKIEQAVMKINPDNNQIGFAFVNGSFWTSMADKDNSYRTWMTSKDFCTSTSFVYDQDGNTYGVMAGGDSGTMADKYNFITSRWGVSEANDSAQNGGNASRNGTRALRLEELCDNTYSGAAFAKQRFMSSSLAVSTKTNGTNVYLAYYDSLYSQIRFRYGRLNSNWKTNFNNFQDSCSSENGWGSYADARKYAQILATGSETVSTDDIAGAKSGEYVSIGVVNNNGNDTVVAVWYDSVNYKMWYAYNTSPTTNRENGVRKDNDTSDGWSDPVVVFTGDAAIAGSYCKLAVDASGGVHIAAFDIANNNVVYAKLPSDKKGEASKTEDFTTCLVDGNSPAGDYLTLDVALDATGNAVPYIGYYSSGCIHPKMAYAVTSSTNAGTGSDGLMTGDWEITVVPTPKKVETQSNQHNPINIGVWKNENGTIKESSSTTSTLTGTKASDMSGKIYGNGTANPVLGYVITDDTIETAQKK